MFRRAALAFAIVASLAGCSASRQSNAKAQAPHERGEFTEEQKLNACLDLQDHIVDLFAEAYLQSEGLTMTPLERAAFRDGWAEELAKRGTFDRFERSCFSGLTLGKYYCGMQSQTTDGLVACMKFSAR